MKTNRLLYTAVLLTLILIPTQTFAAWWNPLSWSFFKKQAPVESVAKPAPTNEVVKQENTQTKKHKIHTEATTTPKTETVKKPVATPAPKSTPAETSLLSSRDEADITATIKSFLFAVSNKDTKKVNSLISTESKEYFDRILYLAEIARKEAVLSQDFSTAFSIIVVRLAAASTTLNQNTESLIARAVTLGSPSIAAKNNINSLKISITPVSTNKAKVIVSSGEKTLATARMVKEYNVWNIDLKSVFSDKDTEVEKEIAKLVVEEKKDRNQIMESLLKIFFGNSTEFNYFAWVPLRERGDLDANNAKFNQGYTSTLDGYSIKYPDGWTTDFVDLTAFFLAPYSSDGIRPTIAITPNLTPYTTNLDAYSVDLVQSLPANKKDVSGEITRTQTTLLGQPAYKISYKRLRTFDSGRTYITQLNDSYVFLKNGYIYLVEYRNGLSDFENTRPLAEKIINTLKFGPICTKNCSTDMYDNN